MNRDIILLLAQYISRPIIVQLIALGLADNYAMISRKLRYCGYRYKDIWSYEFFECSGYKKYFVYDNKYKNINEFISEFDPRRYEPDIIFDYWNGYRVRAIINKSKYLILYSEINYIYKNGLYVYIYNDKLHTLSYIDEYEIKFGPRYLYKLNIQHVLNVGSNYIKFDNDKNIFYGYNDFILYYSCGKIFISSISGRVLIYYKGGKLFMAFNYNSKHLLLGYRIIPTSWRIYSPLGTRLM